MTDYTPTTDDVETAFHEFASNLETKCPGSYEEAPEFSDWKQAMYGFRRWYADVIRKAKAQAWDEGFNAGWEECKNPDAFVNDPWDAKTPNPYTEDQ